MAWIRSQPERFVLSVPPNTASASHQCSFAIPPGEWKGGTWSVIGEIPSGTIFAQKALGSDPLLELERTPGAERYRIHGAIGRVTLAAINQCSGGVYVTLMTDTFGDVQPAGAADIIVACTLTLIGNESTADCDALCRIVTISYDASVVPRRRP